MHVEHVHYLKNAYTLKNEGSKRFFFLSNSIEEEPFFS